MTSRAEILARLAAATPGPWGHDHGKIIAGGFEEPECIGEMDVIRDASLVAHAPDDLRHLLQVIEQMERKLRDETLGGGGSHWAECYRCHIDCATARIAQQRKAIDRFIKAGDELVKHLHYEGHWDALAAWDEAKGGAA